MAKADTATDTATENGEVSKAAQDAASFFDMLQPSTIEESAKLKRGGGGGRRSSKWAEFVNTFMERSAADPENFGVVAWRGLSETSNPTLVAVVAGVNGQLARHKKATGEELPVKVKSSKSDGVVFIINTDVAGD
jgi:hypothetical protein